MPEKTILVVDDDEGVRTTFETVLNAAGYSVHSVGGARDALQIAKLAPIQLFFLDLQMEEMDGLELCRELRKIKPAELIYAITVYHSLYDLVACREAGFDDYFRKPLEWDIMMKAAADAFVKLDRWRGR